MTVSTANATKFWVVCCEENEVTQEIARTVDSWQLPGVRSLIGDRQALLSNVDIIADASYAIFATPYEKPCSQAKVKPLNIPKTADSSAHTATEHNPVDMMAGALNRHGRTPQSWLLQLPKTEIRAQNEQPVAQEKSVAQAIAAIEVFVRNYTRATPLPVSAQPKQAANPKKEVVLSHYRRI